MQSIAVGDRFGRLVVVEIGLRIPSKTRKSGYPGYRCVCDCGTHTTAYRHSLLKGGTRSCGCLAREVTVASHTKHGRYGSSEYRSYKGMVYRCLNEKNKAWDNYGGRGITVHPDWVGEGGFERFYAHIGPKPGPGYSVDRINNDGNYEPGNVRWATPTEQHNNTRNNVSLTHQGITGTLPWWSARTGIPQSTLRNRIRDGWSIEDTLTKPPRANKRRSV